jgi:hypothetical protein
MIFIRPGSPITGVDTASRAAKCVHNARVTLRIDADRKVTSGTCDCCGTPRADVTGFVNKDGVGAYAIYFAHCYHHQGEHEAWIDVIFDAEWDPEHPTRPGKARVTFGCRVGPVKGVAGNACTLVSAADVAPDSPMFGKKLNREEAQAHPWLPLYWEAIDLILTDDPTVDQHMHGSA